MKEKSNITNKMIIIFAISGIIILILGVLLILKASSHSLFTNILFIVSALLGVVLMLININEILKYENKVFGTALKFSIWSYWNEPIKVFHAFAINAIILCFCLFAGSGDLFIGKLFHAMMDGSLAALLVIYSGFFKEKSWLIYGMITGILTGFISYFDIKYATEILFIIFAAVLLIQAIKGKTEIKAFKSTAIITSTAVILLSIITVFYAKNVIHMYIHTSILAAMFFLGLSAYGLVSEGTEKRI